MLSPDILIEDSCTFIFCFFSLPYLMYRIVSLVFKYISFRGLAYPSVPSVCERFFALSETGTVPVYLILKDIFLAGLASAFALACTEYSLLRREVC